MKQASSRKLKLTVCLFILFITFINGQSPFNIHYANVANNPTYTQIWKVTVINKNRIVLTHRYGLIECDSNLNTVKLIYNSAFSNYPSFVVGGFHKAKNGYYLINNPNNFQTSTIVSRWTNSMGYMVWSKGGGVASNSSLNLGKASGPCELDNNSVISDSTTTGISFVTAAINQDGVVLTTVDSSGILTSQKHLQSTQGNLLFGELVRSNNALYTVDYVYAANLILKTDYNLNPLLAHDVKFSDSVTFIKKIKYTTDKHLLLAGYLIKKGNTQQNVIVKLDTLGVTTWAKAFTIANNNNNEILSIEEFNGEYLMSLKLGTNGTGLLAKVDINGNFVSNKSYRSGSGSSMFGPHDDGCDILKKINNNKIICAGEGYFGPTYFVTDPGLNFLPCISSSTVINSSAFTPTLTVLSNTLFTLQNTTPTSTPVYSGGPNIIDTNYVFTACQVTTTIKENKNNEFSVFPNPASSQITITSAAQILDLEIINTIGQLVMAKKYINADTASIDLANLTPGIYFIRLETENGLTVKKIIKQ